MTPKKKILVKKKTNLMEKRKRRLLDKIRRDVFQRMPEDHADRFEGAMDRGDMSTASLLDSVDLRLSVMREEELKKIVAAEEKLRNGTYGICEKCGERIGARRLAALPFALHCIECERKLESDTFQRR
jgi:DnaK suppressor protein